MSVKLKFAPIRTQYLARMLENLALPLARLAYSLTKSRQLRILRDQLKARRAFRSRWTRRNLRDALQLAETVDHLLTSAKIEYSIFSGTLLGAIRHGGVIPWDDDIDLCISGANLDRLLQLAPVFEEKGIKLAEAKRCYKLFWKGRPSINADTTWSWPFVDVFIWDRVGSRIFMRNNHDHYPYACLQPLTRRPFHHLQLPGPREPQPMLDAWFGPGCLTTIISPVYHHRREKLEDRARLVSIFPLPTWREFFQGRTQAQRNQMLLRAAVKFLHECGIEFWLDFGTLLGEQRAGQLLFHERDVDLSMREEDFGRVTNDLQLLDPDFIFYDTSYRNGGLKGGITHRRWGGNCDFYTYRSVPGDPLRLSLGAQFHGSRDARDIPADMIFPLVPTRLEGLAVRRPQEAKKYLLERYGYLGHPAVKRDDGTGHYREPWQQPPWTSEPCPDELARAAGRLA